MPSPSEAAVLHRLKQAFFRDAEKKPGFVLARPRGDEFWTHDDWRAVVTAADWLKRKTRVVHDHEVARRQVLAQEFEAAWRERERTLSEAWRAHVKAEKARAKAEADAEAALLTVGTVLVAA